MKTLNLETYSANPKKKKISGKFINRELSWVSFNSRVLYYANDKKVPLNERLKFLAITESNLDEFLSVRFSYAYENQDIEPYKRILDKILDFKRSQKVVWNNMKKYLKEKKDISFIKMKDLNKKEKDKLFDYYQDNIFPLLTPIIINSENYSPNLMSGQLCIGVILEKGNNNILCIIPISNDIDHIIKIDNKRFILIEDIIKEFANKTLFINETILNISSFRLIKDASFVLSHDNSKFIIDRMKDVLNKRKVSEPIFLEIEDNKELNEYEKFENCYSLFDALKYEDILLHHPYDSYDTVVRFIEHASMDKHVIAIKQTLYRVSSIDSPIVNALCTAARNGKKVSVLIEIKARFDEENNINLIDKLKDAGVTVLLGTEYLKTHCKMCIVVREENDELKIYSHVGTGNYNEKTATQYTDISYLTSKRKIGIDLLNIFNILSGHSRPDEKLEKISYSPVNLRSTIEKNINREIRNAKKGHKAEIFIKVNSLSDPIIDKLYKAADSGVKVYIITRSICSILPRKNLYVKSIVGRFLEHSRIYYFYNNKNPEYYISSADLLTRNLDKRIEVLISLKDSNVIEQIKWIIKVFKEDEYNSFELLSDGTWKHLKGSFNAHNYFIENSNTLRYKKSWK